MILKLIGWLIGIFFIVSIIVGFSIGIEWVLEQVFEGRN